MFWGINGNYRQYYGKVFMAVTTKPVEIKITVRQLLDLIHWARRYCNGRSTSSPHDFNLMYWELANRYPDIVTFDKEKPDNSIEFFPFAQDGMFRKEDNRFNAIKPGMEDITK